LTFCAFGFICCFKVLSQNFGNDFLLNWRGFFRKEKLIHFTFEKLGKPWPEFIASFLEHVSEQEFRKLVKLAKHSWCHKIVS
jgi:hypothetical protein